MTTAGRELSKSCQGFVQGTVDSLNEALIHFERNMTALVNALSEKLDRMSGAASGETAATAAELQRLTAQLSQIIASKEV